MMMALGLFVFSLDTAPYSEFQRQVGWRHPGNARVGRRPSHQYTGPDDETITLSGRLMSELTGGDLTLGRAELFPSLHAKVSGWKPQIDNTAWSVGRVVHRLNGSGYTTTLELEIKPERLEELGTPGA